MTEQSQPEYTIQPHTPPPPGYPQARQADTFRTHPGAENCEQRRQAFLEHVLHNPAPPNTKPVWYELVRMAAGGQPHKGIILGALDFIDARQDCADFVMHSVLRMMYQFGGREKKRENGESRAESGIPAWIDYSRLSNDPLSKSLLEKARSSILAFKYFPDEPGVDSLCTWTENHYILFSSAAYLAGQLYPQAIFTNSGETGQEKMARNRPRILQWLDLRFRTGFSEWLSHVYYDEDLAALLSLVDFCQDAEIAQRARMVIDLLLLDMALNSFQGVFGSSHGRAYEHTKKWAAREGTTDTFRLLFGMGVYSGFDNMSAAAFALSGYRVPAAIAAIARDVARPERVNRQRMGIRLAELERWGLTPQGFEDGMHALTLEAYFHPRTIRNTLRLFDTCNWWDNAFFSAVQSHRGLLRFAGALGALPPLARLLERDICRNTREEVNLYTYHTSDAMLSTAQDYRKGYGGDQQHIWQATLGPDAVCFSTHPARLDGDTPGYWAGSGLLPRAAQHKNVTFAIYKIEKIPALYVPVRHFFTHAWLPKDKFDEVAEQNGWVFARKGEGYLALRSMQPYFWNEGPAREGETFWRTDPEDLGREIIAPGRENIWICQVGRQAVDGAFAAFIRAVSGAELAFDGLNVRYCAPGLGLLQFGWEGPLRLDGQEIALHGYSRYDNPYVQAPFDPPEIEIAAGGQRLRLAWESACRTETET